MAGLSKYQVLRRFEKAYGVPPHAWLLQRRAERARVADSRRRRPRGGAAACGFADQSHMTRVFVRQFGFTPGAWRKPPRCNSVQRPQVSAGTRKLRLCASSSPPDLPSSRRSASRARCASARTWRCRAPRPIAPDGGVAAPGDMYGQTKRCLEIIAQAIGKAGLGLDSVIRTRVMLTDISRWEEAARAHGEMFGAIKPASTFVEVKGLINKGWLVEIEADCVADADPR